MDDYFQVVQAGIIRSLIVVVVGSVRGRRVR